MEQKFMKFLIKNLVIFKSGDNFIAREKFAQLDLNQIIVTQVF